jgi:hypothetical protein
LSISRDCPALDLAGRGRASIAEFGLAISEGEETMYRNGVMAVVLIGIVACFAWTTGSARAEKPEFAPTTSNPYTAIGENAELEIKGGFTPITVVTSEGKGEITSAKEGTFDELYLGTKAPLTGNCTGLSDLVSSSVLAKGKFKIGYLDSAKTKVGIVLKLEPVHFECAKLITLVIVEGAVIGSITPINTKVRTLTITMKLLGGGVNEWTQILNATNTGFEKFTLKAELNGAPAAQAGVESTVRLTTGFEVAIVA